MAPLWAKGRWRFTESTTASHANRRAHVHCRGLAKAVSRAVLHGCEALQIFSRNANQWAAPPPDPADVRAFRMAVDRTGITPVVSHASYLINLATTDPTLRQRSIAAFIDEIDRAHALGLLGVIIHPGACTAGSTDEALALVADAIRTAFRARPRRRTKVLLEHTAGQGRTIGHRFEHLAAIIEHLDGSPRVGVCLDTCHLFASGYDIASDDGFARTFEAFGRIVGFDRLHAVHANDSKTPCGSRVDRHAHIGEGYLGLAPFRRILRDRRFHGRPLLIETAKTSRRTPPGAIVTDPLDARNLEVLRRLRADAS